MTRKKPSIHSKESSSHRLLQELRSLHLPIFCETWILGSPSSTFLRSTLYLLQNFSSPIFNNFNLHEQPAIHNPSVTTTSQQQHVLQTKAEKKKYRLKQRRRRRESSVKEFENLPDSRTFVLSLSPTFSSLAGAISDFEC